jgi:Secretion system C-terminal sorting domain/SprB repeat
MKNLMFTFFALLVSCAMYAQAQHDTLKSPELNNMKLMQVRKVRISPTKFGIFFSTDEKQFKEQLAQAGNVTNEATLISNTSLAKRNAMNISNNMVCPGPDLINGVYLNTNIQDRFLGVTPNQACQDGSDEYPTYYPEYKLYKAFFGTNGDLSVIIDNVSPDLDPAMFILSGCTSASSYIACIDNGGGLGHSETVPTTAYVNPCTPAILKIQHWMRTSAGADCTSCSFRIKATWTTCTTPCNLSVTAVQTQAATAGNADGVASATATGGSGNLQYDWSDDGMTSVNQFLVAGIYTVTVTDLNNPTCMATASVTITQTGGGIGCNMTLTAFQTSPASAGQNDGAASCTPNNNSAGTVTYEWSNGSTNRNLTGVGADTYTVTATDAQGCTASAEATIQENNPCANTNLSATTTTIAATCTASNGSATVIANGGTPPYTYLWGPTGESWASVQNRPAGQYIVTITDDDGCESVATAVIASNNPATISLTCPNPQICAVGSTLISTTGSGGWTGFLWSNGEQTPQIIANAAATYNVVATDNNGCTAASSFTITQYAPTNIAITGVSQICKGASTTLTVTGGNAVWNTAATTPAITITPDSTTTYTVQVTDLNSCAASTVKTVIVNPLPVISTQSPAYICTQKDSVLLVATTVNLSPTYIWSNAATQASTHVFATGTYSVTVTDGKGCFSSASVVVQEGAKITGTMTSTNIGNTYDFHITTNTPPITLIESIIEDFNNGQQIATYTGDMFSHIFSTTGFFHVAAEIKGICNNEVVEAFIETGAARLSNNFGMKYGSANNALRLISFVETSDNDIIALFKAGNSAVIARLSRENGKVMCADKYEYEAEPISITPVGADAYALVLRANGKEYLIRINTKTNRIASIAYKNMPTKTMAYSAANSKWVGAYKDPLTQQEALIKTNIAGGMDTGYPKVIPSTTGGSLAIQKIIPNGTGFILLVKNGGNPQIIATDADFNTIWKRDISAPNMTFTQAVIMNGNIYIGGNSDLGLFFTKVNAATQQIVVSKLLNNNDAKLIKMQLDNVGNIVIVTDKTVLTVNENFDIINAYAFILPQNTVINDALVTTQNRIVFGGNSTANGVQQAYIANSNLATVDVCLLQPTTIRFTPYTITLDNFYGIQLTTIAKPSNEILYLGRVITNLETNIVCGQLTNTVETVKNQTVTIFPNPATHTLNLRATDDIHEIMITNNLGQALFYLKNNIGTTAVVNTTDFPTGMYFVTVKTGNATSIQKLLIQK